MTTTDNMTDFIFRLAGEVFALRTELEDLTQQLSTEVRTRRLVVVDELGAAKIEANVGADFAGVVVRTGKHDGSDDEVELYANEQSCRLGSEYDAHGLALISPMAGVSVIHGEILANMSGTYHPATPKLAAESVAHLRLESHSSAVRGGGTSIELKTYESDAELAMWAANKFGPSERTASMGLNVSDGWEDERGEQEEPVATIRLSRGGAEDVTLASERPTESAVAELEAQMAELKQLVDELVCEDEQEAARVTTTHAIDMERLTVDALHMLGTVIRFHDQWRDQIFAYYDTPERMACCATPYEDRTDEYDRDTGFDVANEAVAATIHLAGLVTAWDAPYAAVGEEYLARHRAAALSAKSPQVNRLEGIIEGMIALGSSAAS